MTVSLYNNASDPRVVHKNITLIQTINNVDVTAEIGIENISLLLNMISTVASCNYCYIQEFGRYYYLSPSIQNGNQVLFTGEVDVLMSHWNKFNGSICTAERSTSAQNPDIEDQMLPFKSQPTYIYRKLAQGFTPSSTGGSYILTLGGK